MGARIEAPQRGSTRSVYEAKWTIFTKWCITNQVDFQAPPVKSVADFLMYLFEDRKLQSSTIDGYRSAIADKLGNSTFNISKDENLTRLLDSFHRDRPKGRRGSAELRFMLGKTKIPDTNLTGQRCPCINHPAFFPRTSWPKRVQTVWPQWLYQPWSQLWIDPSSLIGPSVRSEHYATIWTGPQAE